MGKMTRRRTRTRTKSRSHLMPLPQSSSESGHTSVRNSNQLQPRPIRQVRGRRQGLRWKGRQPQRLPKQNPQPNPRRLRRRRRSQWHSQARTESPSPHRHRWSSLPPRRPNFRNQTRKCSTSTSTRPTSLGCSPGRISPITSTTGSRRRRGMPIGRNRWTRESRGRSRSRASRPWSRRAEEPCRKGSRYSAATRCRARRARCRRPCPPAPTSASPPEGRRSRRAAARARRPRPWLSLLRGSTRTPS
mmetsp:Transcript_8534/g.20969  ORF Transcript_8534/g.20969 Transcript_8534/m.20969 type:complete len:246 (-) Transcript_8534:1013-1750(-)